MVAGAARVRVSGGGGVASVCQFVAPRTVHLSAVLVLCPSWQDCIRLYKLVGRYPNRARSVLLERGWGVRVSYVGVEFHS